MRPDSCRTLRVSLLATAIVEEVMFSVITVCVFVLTTPEHHTIRNLIFSTAEDFQLWYTNHPVVVVGVVCGIYVIVDRC